MAFNVGDKVTASYRYNPAADNGKYWVGQVLAKDDPKAWAHTLAFYGQDNPDPIKVKAHVEQCESCGLSFENDTPVAWEFGRVYWEKTEDLRAV